MYKPLHPQESGGEGDGGEGGEGEGDRAILQKLHGDLQGEHNARAKVHA